MLQPRESRLLWRRRKRRNSIEILSCSKIYSILMVISCLNLLPQGITQNIDDVYIVKPTPALRSGKEELTTVLLVNNENHGRYINVRPEIGLLTSTARTFIQEGVTTEYATQVVGTTLDNGRVYAQYLKKSSRVLYDSGIPVPSVVTSWVGETLKSDAGLLPQSHNDLFDADQADWQAIDDRLLLEHHHQDNFVGNTDYVGSRLKTTLNLNSKTHEDVNSSFGISSSLGSVYSKPAYNFVAQLGVLEENARKVAANKVLPIGDLPTYTIKRNFEPNALVVANDDALGEGYDSGEVLGRSPKLIYKSFAQNGLKTSNESQPSHLSKAVIPASRSFATVTYYGFADFTTVVGDSVIVFSPSTSTFNNNYNAHITSIKGEATLGVGSPQGPSISKVPITIAQDVIEPTVTLQSTLETLFEQPLSSNEITVDSSSSTSHLILTEELKNSATETEIRSNILETSEVSVEPTQMQSETLFTQSSNSTMPAVMLSRPSDEEILRIYNALANAAAEKIKTEATISETTPSPNLITTSSDTTSVAEETSGVQIFGGATTIFFEDDPFANFVNPSKTSLDTSTSATAFDTQAATNDEEKTTTAAVTESSAIESSTTGKIAETTTEREKVVDSSTGQPVSKTETTSLLEASETATTTEPALEQAIERHTESPSVLPNVLIKEIDPDNDEELPSDCISTSQVFLTQLPKTTTILETSLVTDQADPSRTITEIIEKVQPTFEIKEATKYYCIQASTILANQVESPTVRATLAVNSLEDAQASNEKINKQIDESDITVKADTEEATEEVSLTTTEKSEIETKTEGNDFNEKHEGVTTEHGNTGLSGFNESEYVKDEDLEASGQQDEDEEEEDEEIELIYKTLYTTYTYLTTFFHDDSTSISSHTEVVTNIMTSTLGIEASKESTATELIANLNENEINPTDTVNSVIMESTKRYVVPSEVENFVRTDDKNRDEKESISETLENSSSLSKRSETLATFYTTYTYYTTIFAEGETEVMSHTEVITNVKKSTATIEEVKISPTLSAIQPSSTVNIDSPAYTTLGESEVSYKSLNADEVKPSVPSSSTIAYGEAANSPNIPDLGDLSAITLITDVRSSSSPGDKQIINSFEAKFANDKFTQQSIFEDQISSESNTDTDEIIPSATLLLQTSFTTFTYYTTMYSGDKTNVVSRLETMTNTVTETLQPSKTIDLEGASLPITYFTTFTYWTKLAREGQITTLSREETISNVILPTLLQSELQSQTEPVHGQTTTSELENEASTSRVIKQQLVETNIVKADQLSTAEILESSSAEHRKNILEPTTYYTTYTYYTTSYETDKTITDSRFETVTNIVTPSDTLSQKATQNEELTPTLGLSLSSTSASPTPKNVDKSSDLVLYDFKKIIDADGISTIFFTTEIKPTSDAEGARTEVISSSSSLFIDEEKRNIQASATAESSAVTLGPDGQPQKHYKTGLVRLIEGTRIANHTTTLYQSKVIGTIIDQRYAQIIESTSSFIFEKLNTDAPEVSENISPTSSSNIEKIQPTEQVSIVQSRPSQVEGSIIDNSSEEEIDTTTKHDLEQDEESNLKTDERLRSPFQTKKPQFISPLKPFGNRNRPQFAPKKNSSATIITRSDFTPTITATPALKTLNRFSSTRRGSASGPLNSNTPLFATSSRRFGRPNKSSSSGLQSSAAGFSGGSRNRFSSSSIARSSFASSSRRLGGSAASIRPSFSRPSLFSTGFPGNSRARNKASSTLDLGESTATVDISTSQPPSSQEEGFSDDPENEEEITTESNRRQNNPLLRLRRPLNRPQGFSPARPQSNSPNNGVSLRRNPLLGRSRSGNISTTSTTTTTTSKPKTRPFQPPLISQNRIRPTSSLFPPRNIFAVQKPQVATQENKDISEEDTNENNDDSEYEDEDDEDSDLDDEEETSRRRRSSNKNEQTETKIYRRKREAENIQRSNFRNRFRRPKLTSLNQAETRSNEDDTTEAKEPVTTAGPVSTSSHRTRTRFGNRFSGHSSSSSPTSAATSTSAPSNHKAIRPTRPSSNNGGRAQFTLREKDSSIMSTTQKGSSYVKRPAFRRPQPGGSIATRRLPSSTAPSSSTSGKRRLKSYSNNDSTTTSRNSVTGRSRSSTTTSGRTRPSASSRDNNIGGRNRGRKNNNNEEGLLFDNGGTITVTHVSPAEVTIPVINGKVTEYKQVVTAKTSTEVLGPQQYTTSINANGLSQLALTREDSSVNYHGATEVTKYILHETPTTTITFTPTTIRGRKTSFSHVLPSTVYSVEQVVSTVQPQISANAPLANILLSQLLLGNVGLPGANPLLALGGALTQPGTAVGPPQPATPVTEYKTHASTYVTTLYEGQSTVLPVTFQGKKILTTIFDTSAQTITATEFITDTIVTTPTVMAQPQPVVNSLLLQQLLLQQHLQQQQQLQQATPDSLNAILNSVPPQFLLGGDNLQELEASNNIRGSGHGDLLNEDDDFAVGSSVDLDDIALQAQAQTHKSGKKKSRKNGKSHKRKNNNNGEPHPTAESSVITLYVSGRRPGEFSTVLSTVQVRPDSTQYKRHAHIIDSPIDYYNDGSETMNEYLPLPPEIVLLDNKAENRNKFEYENIGNDVATQSLESIVGDVSVWFASQLTGTETHAIKLQQPSTTSRILEHSGSKLEQKMNSTKQYFFA